MFFDRCNAIVIPISEDFCKIVVMHNSLNLTANFISSFDIKDSVWHQNTTILEINKEELDASKDKFNQTLRNVVL